MPVFITQIQLRFSPKLGGDPLLPRNMAFLLPPSLPELDIVAHVPSATGSEEAKVSQNHRFRVDDTDSFLFIQFLFFLI